MTDLPEALEEHIPALRRYASALLGNRDRADELVQDTLERALSRRHLFRVDRNLRGWLFTIMHNLYANNARSRSRAPGFVPVEDAAHRLSDGPHQDDHMALRDLQRALSEMTPQHRTVLLLIGLEGLSYREAAEVLDIPVGTVMSRLARARERLRLMLGDGRGTVPAVEEGAPPARRRAP
ncbi:RNA polymerase sigma factor [Kaustia mangrovi]|uniref:RNA polymerase sigma factor n=1 Tax=Kaustia mangrovi TaxID=2593653 RepID=A0A7S8HBE5_9HYPH|nr:RNA polymerase sigma factor [Kaustia mangrovi]QPC42103.1 RNA polymerase sigma factor [Kaustia mangrovi]